MWTAETLAERYGADINEWRKHLIYCLRVGILDTPDDAEYGQRIAQCNDWATAAQIHNFLVAYANGDA